MTRNKRGFTVDHLFYTDKYIIIFIYHGNYIDFKPLVSKSTIIHRTYTF